MCTQKHRYKANEMSEDSLPQSQQDKFDFDKTQSDIWYGRWLLFRKFASIEGAILSNVKF